MRTVYSLGAFANFIFSWAGAVCRMLLDTVLRGPRRPFGLPDIAYQIVQFGLGSLVMTTLMGGFLGMIFSWQFGEGLARFSAEQTLGTVAGLALVRELVPAILAITVGVKIATGITAELGSMKVSEQIDAIASLGADPIKKLVWPRLVAATICLPLLVGWGNIVAVVGGMVIADPVFGVEFGYFYDTYINALTPLNYLSSIVKALVFGLIAGIVGSFQGFNTKFGTEAVGISTTETVIATTVAVVIADFVLTTLFVQV